MRSFELTNQPAVDQVCNVWADEISPDEIAALLEIIRKERVRAGGGG